MESEHSAVGVELNTYLNRESLNMAEKHNVRLSKALSWLLRHNLHLVSEITKAEIDSSGYVDVEAVLKLPRFAGYSISQVEQVVAINDKQRFALRFFEDFL